MIKFDEIPELLEDATIVGHPTDMVISKIYYDSRKISNGTNGLFVALKGNIHDGHLYLQEAYDKGVHHFLVEKLPHPINPDACYVKVRDVLKSLQKLAKIRLERSNLKHKIGITGSNGKTIVKEWLYTLLSDTFSVVKTPKSYNSQLGVVLSVWEVQPYHEIGIFEVGVSEKNEMQALYDILTPDIGIFTNLGDAHNVGFDNLQDKLEEKLLLFQSCETLIFENKWFKQIANALKNKPITNLLSWGKNTETPISDQENKLNLSPLNNAINQTFNLDTDRENAMNAAVCAAYLGMGHDHIIERLGQLKPLSMRLEIVEGIYGSTVINDSYNADFYSFVQALEFAKHHNKGQQKTLILSKFDELGFEESQFISEIEDILNDKDYSQCIFIGTKPTPPQKSNVEFFYYSDIQSFIKHFNLSDIYNHQILVKGSRNMHMDRIVDFLSKANHSVNLEIDLEVIGHNLSYFASLIPDDCGIIGVIKAGGYGSGAETIAKFLEYRKIAYLAVANVDEGISLRESGIKLPIIILNPSIGDIDILVKYNLEPEIYDLNQWVKMDEILSNIPDIKLNIHLKIDSGMHRLGLDESSVAEIAIRLKESKNFVVKTIFSHLAATDLPAYDEDTKIQAQYFLTQYDFICRELGYRPKKHLLNTSGIPRFSEYHFDFVRIGLGLYGLEKSLFDQGKIVPAHRFFANVIQIKNLKKGDKIGYNYQGIMPENGSIAVVNIGYADGLPRACSNGKISLEIKGKKAKILGNISMDLTIIDISDIPDVRLGERVKIFGVEGNIFEIASKSDTIPYEILSRISPRVVRKYVEG
ncbi:MAG TPA: alanine racemase [Saprospiraceae bacterium]|nr:alanine racemase [Saprospiraceae bacterium]